MTIYRILKRAVSGALLLVTLAACVACGVAVRQSDGAASARPSAEQPARPAASGAPTVELRPTATLEPVTLAVAEDVWAQYGAELAALLAGYPNVGVELAVNGEPAAEGQAALAWRSDGEGALAVRAEPWVVARHVAAAGAGAGGQVLAVGDDGRVARELLGLERLGRDTVYAAGWQAAKEYVATHEEAWALLPWEVVDFRVAVAWPGEAGVDRFQRRLMLSGADELPAGLAGELAVALAYQPPAMLELVAVGDIMLDRGVGERIAAHSPDYPFQGEGIQPLLAGADLALGNLECAISARGERRPKGYEFRADPAVVAGLTYAGFDILSLANNHTGDYSPVALQDTIDLLTAAQIVPVGAGENLAAARQAQIMWIEGLRVAFLAYDQVGPDWLWATDSTPGCAPMRTEQMTADVQAARQRADVVVVICHWGYEYTPYASTSQREVARALAEAGAALVIGGHAHVVQGVEYREDTFIAYGLGNFVFDINRSRETREGLILRCLIDAMGVKRVELIACDGGDAQPRLAEAGGDNQALARVWRVTREHGGLPQ